MCCISVQADYKILNRSLLLQLHQEDYKVHFYTTQFCRSRQIDEAVSFGPKTFRNEENLSSMYVLNLRSHTFFFVEVCRAVSRKSELCSAFEITSVKTDRFNILRPACTEMQHILASITYISMERIGRRRLSAHTQNPLWLTWNGPYRFVFMV